MKALLRLLLAVGVVVLLVEGLGRTPSPPQVAGRLLQRIPLGADAVGAWEIRSRGGGDARWIVAATGRRVRAEQERAGSVLLYDEWGVLQDEATVPAECPLLDEKGERCSQAIGANRDHCAVLPDGDADLFLVACTGNQAPSWISAFDVVRAPAGQARLRRRLALWHYGTIDTLRVFLGRSVFFTGCANRVPHPRPDDYGRCLFRIDLPAEGEPAVEGSLDPLGQAQGAVPPGVRFYLWMPPLRTRSSGNGKFGETVDLRTSGEGAVDWILRPPGLNATLTLEFDREGRIRTVRPSDDLAAEYAGCRLADEPEWEPWLRDLREAALRGRIPRVPAR